MSDTITTAATTAGLLGELSRCEPFEREHRLLGELASCRRHYEAAQERMRCLLAYAREFQGRRPLPLRALGEAAGRSHSNVSTGYGADEVAVVAAALGVAVPEHWRE